jgi:hypothetical protein
VSLAHRLTGLGIGVIGEGPFDWESSWAEDASWSSGYVDDERLVSSSLVKGGGVNDIGYCRKSLTIPIRGTAPAMDSYDRADGSFAGGDVELLGVILVKVDNLLKRSLELRKAAIVDKIMMESTNMRQLRRGRH